MNDILTHTTRRESKLAVRARVKALDKTLARQTALYAGGTPAELGTLDALTRQHSDVVLREWLAHLGRPFPLATPHLFAPPPSRP